MVIKVAPGQAFIPVFLLYLVSIIPPKLQTHLFIITNNILGGTEFYEEYGQLKILGIIRFDIKQSRKFWAPLYKI
jgi:hypothetical protein